MNCLVSTGTNCTCADLDGNGLLDMVDVSLFVDALLAGNDCPWAGLDVQPFLDLILRP